MELPAQLSTAFDNQMTLELESSITYLQMAGFFEHRSLKGMAAWMRIQSDEERQHFFRFFDFVLDRGNQVTLGEIPAPRSEFSNPVEVFSVALEQERRVSEAIRHLYRLATDTGDVESLPLLQTFLQEQVEEEKIVSEALDQLRLVGDDGAALLQLDRELGSRTANG